MRIVLFSAEIELDFSSNEIPVLEICNDAYLFDIIKELKFPSTEKEIREIIIYENNKELNISRELFLLIDPFSIDLNSRSITTEFYKKINNIYLAEAEVSSEINSIYRNLTTQLEKLIMELEIDYNIKTDFETKDLLKALGLEIVETPEDPFSSLLSFISIVSALKLFKLIALVNPRCFLKEQELSELYKVSSYKEVPILVLQNKSYYRLPNESKILIDEELFSRIEK